MPFSGYQDLDAAFSEALQKFIAESPGIAPTSGYRTPEYQAVLFNRAIKKYGSPEKARHWVAPPGKSRHGFRKAVDLDYTGKGAKAWAHANAAKYGLTFPMGHEDWHIEPIGARGEAHSHDTTQMNASASVGAGGGKPALSQKTAPATVGTQPVIVQVTADTEKPRSRTGKVSDSLANYMELMNKQKEANWAWVQQAMPASP